MNGQLDCQVVVRAKMVHDVGGYGLGVVFDLFGMTLNLLKTTMIFIIWILRGICVYLFYDGSP